MQAHGVNKTASLGGCPRVRNGPRPARGIHPGPGIATAGRMSMHITSLRLLTLTQSHSDFQEQPSGDTENEQAYVEAGLADAVVHSTSSGSFQAHLPCPGNETTTQNISPKHTQRYSRLHHMKVHATRV